MATSRYIGTIKKIITNQGYRMQFLSNHGFYRNMSDEVYLERLYKACMGKKLNIQNPKTFNEKLQWLKLNDRRSEYTAMVDKYEVKKYIASKIGEDYIIPTLGVWNNFDDIDFGALPNQFVLKCTHDSGGLVICRNKKHLNVKHAREKINKSLKSNYYFIGREYPYKNVKPRIIAEQFMVDNSTSELRDYKFFCFGGVCKCMKVDFDRFIEHRANYYDPQGNILDIGETICPPNPQKNIVLPDNMDKMIELAEELSKGIPFLRADFYDVNGRIYFGELTFYPASGFGTFTDDAWDVKLGELKDYKIHCFNGEPRMALVCSDRFSEKGLREDFFDEDWTHMPIKRPEHPNAEIAIKKPLNYKLMKDLARKLAI